MSAPATVTVTVPLDVAGRVATLELPAPFKPTDVVALQRYAEHVLGPTSTARQSALKDYLNGVTEAGREGLFWVDPVAEVPVSDREPVEVPVLRFKAREIRALERTARAWLSRFDSMHAVQVNDDEIALAREIGPLLVKLSHLLRDSRDLFEKEHR